MIYGKCSKLHGINAQLHTRLSRGKKEKKGKGVKSRRLVGAEWSAGPKTETPKTLLPDWKLLSSSASALLFSSPPSPRYLLYNSPVFTSYNYPTLFSSVSSANSSPHLPLSLSPDRGLFATGSVRILPGPLDFAHHSLPP